MRVSMDDSILSDARVRRLMTLTGLTLREVIGTLFLVWLPCYTRRSETLPKDEIDIAADRDGFAEAMIKAKLAIEYEPGMVRVVGADERIDYLRKQKVKSDRGVEARRSAAQPGLPLGQPAGNPLGQPAGSSAGQPAGTVGSPAADPSDLVRSPDRDRDRDRERSSAAADLARPKGPRGFSQQQRESARALLDLVVEKRRRFTGRTLTIASTDVDRVCILFAAGYTYDDIQTVILHREREVQTTPEALKYFNLATPFRKDLFSTSLGFATAEHRPRNGANGAAGHARLSVPNFGPDLPSRQGQAK